jgi:hypothetical protein
MALIKPTTTATKLIFEYQVASFPRKRESSAFIKKAFGFVSALRSAFLFGWIPAFAGMTKFRSIQNLKAN